MNINSDLKNHKYSESQHRKMPNLYIWVFMKKQIHMARQKGEASSPDPKTSNTCSHKEQFKDKIT